VLAAVTPFVASGITALGKTVLVLVALTFILWSLYTAMVIPRRYPNFPRRLDVYIVVTVILFAAQMTAVLWVTGTQEVETHEETSVEAGGGEAVAGGETTTGEETTAGDETTAGGETATGGEETTADGEDAAAGDATAGAAVFASAGCGGCHTLADAGAAGAVGPNLDEAKPSASLVVDRVTNGKGGMPPFSGRLDEQQIADVAAYVSSVAGA
jgi:mono/diheme cytochrome c family protein